MVKTLVGTAIVGLVLAGCGGDNNGPSGPRFVQQIAVPNVGATTNFSFDLGTVAGSTYYFTDRTNAAVNSIDIPTPDVRQPDQRHRRECVRRPATSRNATSGPDGINVVGNQLYVGDVNSVKVIDPTTKHGGEDDHGRQRRRRADEGCLDATHGLYMISTPEAAPPFSTFINTTTQTVVAQVTFTDPSGAAIGRPRAVPLRRGSRYLLRQQRRHHREPARRAGRDDRRVDPRHRRPAPSVNYTTLAGVQAYPEGNCDPTGLALGPGTDIAVNCREATTGAPLLVQILNRSTGAIVASVNAGGGDQIEYDSVTNRYYNGASRWTASGNAAVERRLQRHLAVHAGAADHRRGLAHLDREPADRQQRALGRGRPDLRASRSCRSRRQARRPAAHPAPPTGSSMPVSRCSRPGSAKGLHAACVQARFARCAARRLTIAPRAPVGPPDSSSRARGSSARRRRPRAFRPRPRSPPSAPVRSRRGATRAGCGRGCSTGTA